MNLEDVLKELIEQTPEVPVGYIGKNNLFKSTIESFVNEIGGIFKEIKEEEYRPNTHDRSVEYVFVEETGDFQEPYKLAYNCLESVGLVIFIEKNGFDIWDVSAKFMENFLSEATSIEIENNYSLITSKKLLRS